MTITLPTEPGAVLGYRRDGRPIHLLAGGDHTAEETMRARLVEIDERMPVVRSELLTLAEGDMDETQATRFDELETEFHDLETERAPLARRAETLDRVRTAQVRGVGLEGPTVQRRVDPYDNIEQVRTNSLGVADVRSRALAAIEQAPEYMTDEQRERASQLVRRQDKHGRIARHILLTGSDDYLRAFEGVLGGLEPWQLDDDARAALSIADEQRRVMSEGSDGAGGYLVPFHLDPTIILTSAQSVNPFRQISRVESITTNEWHGITTAGVSAEWLAEHAEAADASPTLTQPAVPVFKGAAWLQGSFEVTQDTNIASSVGMLIADAKDRLEAAAFTLGNGTSAPKGVLTTVGATAGSRVTSTTADTYAVADVYKVAGALPARYRANSSWVMNNAIALLTRQFASGSGPAHAFWADLGMATPSQLLGRPVYEASGMDGSVDASTDNDIMLLGDFSNFLIVDRIGMTVQYEPLVKGANQRPTGEVGWFAHWRVGSDVLVADAFRLLRA